jgi:hypothetical protein
MNRLQAKKSLILAGILGTVFLLLAFGRNTIGRSEALQTVDPLIPREPPRADLISFGPLDGLGEATVTGAAGAVLGSAHVLLVNASTTHQDYVIAGPDGSFQAKIFAPPGSFIVVKHGPDHDIWVDTPSGAIQPGLTVFPFTTIYRPFSHGGGVDGLPFADAGSINVGMESMTTTIEAAWSITGTVSPVTDLMPGGTITVEATIRLYSQAISSTADLSGVQLQMDPDRPWLMLYNDAGDPFPATNQAGSTRLTPSGFPILEKSRPEIKSSQTWNQPSWQYIGGNMAEGQLTISWELSSDLPPGIYRPVMGLEFDGVPAGSDWRAAIMIPFTYENTEAPLPPLEVIPSTAQAKDESESGQNLRQIWYLFMDHASLGTRGAGAIEDSQRFQPASLVTTQGAPYVIPSLDPYSGNPIEYRLEPYLPQIAYGRGALPSAPLLPFELPGGQLCVTVHDPDGSETNLGCAGFVQSVSGDESNRDGLPLNIGGIEVSEYYGLTTNEEDFVVTFLKPGYYQIEMTGWVEDVWGNVYEGGGTYEVWIAEPLDIDPGFLPGTPLAISDTLNTAVQLNPRVPAFVDFTVRHYPESDPGQLQTFTASGFANRFGYFAAPEQTIVLTDPGEYRVNLVAHYLDPDTGEMYLGAATWGGVVMTPPAEATLVAHGRRGMDNLQTIPSQWFVLCGLNPPDDSTPHILNPYLNGDVIWSQLDPSDDLDCLGDSLVVAASIQDPGGAVETAIKNRFDAGNFQLQAPGTMEDRILADALPLFTSTTNGHPASMFPGNIDQIAYAYLSSQRPGVRVRESIAEDSQGSGYWRFDGMYDNQPGVGIDGDRPNDFKFQFVGVVYRDLASGLSEYLGQGSGWFHLPVSDTTGSRVMPPFSGPGNGGWPTTGGPLLTLKGEAVHMFILPTGVRPGSVLQIGDDFIFGGHMMPTLDSQVQVEVTAPSGQKYLVTGRANPVGYFYDPASSFTVDEPGLWTAQVQVWHDGAIGSGDLVNCDPADPFDPGLPCPSGDVLGSASGTYSFYVVLPESDRLIITSPAPGPLTFGATLEPITISGPIPAGASSPVVDYTISMPGYILKEGRAQIAGGMYSISFDPVSLHVDFPNLDLHGRHGFKPVDPGLADTFSFSLLLTGQIGGQPIYQATTLTIQGDLVYVEDGLNPILPGLQSFLPVVLKQD